MSKPEALRLAEQLEAIGLCGPVAAELRRLHDMVERIGPLAERVLELKAQRDALLEALKTARALITEAASTGFNPMEGDWPERLFASQQATSAATKAVEGEKA